MPTKKILVFDDHPIVIEGLKQLLVSEDSFEVTKGVASFEKLYSSLNQEIDILLFDINIKGQNSLSQIKDIKALKKDLKILIFSSYNTPSIVKKAFKEPINGFILKNIRRTELLEALHTVAEGKTYIGKNIALPKAFNRAIEKPSEFNDNFIKLSKLTLREREITSLIVKGLNNQSIAEQLHISSHTVKVHRKNIFKKLEINSAGALIKLSFNIKI
jgi:DNA-binding NarL/FixJ family response regulator